METVEGEIIDVTEINKNVVPEPPKKKCKTCKQGKEAVSSVRKTQKILVFASLYILFAGIYGTIKLIKDILNYFGY